MTRRHALQTLTAAALMLCGCLLLLAGAWLTARDPLLAAADAVLGRRGGGLSAMPFEQALSALCAAVLLGCALWLLVTTALAAASYVAGGLRPGSTAAAALTRAAERRCPRAVRRLVTAVLGVAVTVGAAGPVVADTPGTPVLTGLALPDRTTGAVVATTASRTRAPAPARTVVVAPGDSLWSISAALLPASATDVDVTRAWHRLHRANARRVGKDPDLILPGTRLRVPHLAATDRKDP